ncbi:MAG: hypothetical protein ACLFM1_04060 [Bacteroidales bacterium]
MKKSLSIILMILVGGFFAFTSCDDEETTDPGTNPKATLKGTVYAELDLDNTSAETVPAGKKIIFRINAEDLVLDPVSGYTYQTLQYETETDSDGNYSIDLPTATHQAVPVEVQAVSFEAQQAQTDDSYKDKVYEHDGGSMTSLRDSEVRYLDIVYSDM